jgi:tetratricopeptide (TPR) repeat protein
MISFSKTVGSSRARGAWLALLLTCGSGCAHRVDVRPPDGLDYRLPEWRPQGVSPKEQKRLESAWGDVLAGDSARAIETYHRLLRARPGLLAAQTGLAFAHMRSRAFSEAEGEFAAVLDQYPDYLPALIGAATLTTRAGNAEGALSIYQHAFELAPRDRLVERRLQEVKAQVMEARVADARAALARGDHTASIESYRSALEMAPEVSGIRIALADVLQQTSDSAAAVELLESAPIAEPGIQDRLAEIFVETGQLDSALEIYRVRLLDEPDNPRIRQRSDEVRRRIELLQMPEEYRTIADREWLRRADLAALIVVKITGLRPFPGGPSKVVIDSDRSWAEEHIQRAADLEILSVYSNHTFKPDAIVRRDELAHAIGRVLDLLQWPEEPAPELRDVRPAHLYYRGVTRAVGAGLMDVTPTGAFEGWRPVSGHTAVAVIEALASTVAP